MAAITVKICGLSSAATIDTAVEAGADMIGLVFYPPSPRAVTAEKAAELAARIPSKIRRVGLFVDAADAFLEDIVTRVPLDLLQLHGKETPERCAAINNQFSVPVMKVFRLRERADLTPVTAYEETVHQFLFDAKPPEEMTSALPGGNGIAFDWTLLRDFRTPLPWMLSGGLTAETVAEAIHCTGAAAVDVSSGVEIRPGEKDPSAIRRFIRAAKAAASPRVA